MGKFKTGDRVKILPFSTADKNFTGIVVDTMTITVAVEYETPRTYHNETRNEESEVSYGLFPESDLELLIPEEPNSEWEELWESGEDDG